MCSIKNLIIKFIGKIMLVLMPVNVCGNIQEATVHKPEGKSLL